MGTNIETLNLGERTREAVLSTDTSGRITMDKSIVGDKTTKIVTFAGSVAPLSASDHLINFAGATLAANCNAIRGASLNPTRTSGWTSFSGTITTTPDPVYSDYRELHTAGTAEILGIGSFPFMDSGSSCQSMFALQAICEVDAGATVESAAGAAGVGIFPITAKCLLNGETFTAGGVAAAAFLSFQANVTDVKNEDTSMINMEVASGGINSIFKFQCTSVNGATYFVNFADNALPAEKTTAKTTAINDVVGNIKVLIGDQVGYINIHSAKAT